MMAGLSNPRSVAAEQRRHPESMPSMQMNVHCTSFQISKNTHVYSAREHAPKQCKCKPFRTNASLSARYVKRFGWDHRSYQHDISHFLLSSLRLTPLAPNHGAIGNFTSPGLGGCTNDGDDRAEAASSKSPEIISILQSRELDVSFVVPPVWKSSQAFQPLAVQNSMLSVETMGPSLVSAPRCKTSLSTKIAGAAATLSFLKSSSFTAPFVKPPGTTSVVQSFFGSRFHKRCGHLVRSVRECFPMPQMSACTA
mmetsp:Transcript_74402/g.162737  ORF Transcript_74402/g.162737 Transcript_74402/m.162737 type:complete len:253 (-) Transcript_74402:2217-2975(-)